MANYPRPLDPTWQHAVQQQSGQQQQPSLQLEEDYEIIHGTYSPDDFSGMDQHSQHSQSVQNSPYNFNFNQPQPSPNMTYGFNNQPLPSPSTSYGPPQYATQPVVQNVPPPLRPPPFTSPTFGGQGYPGQPQPPYTQQSPTQGQMPGRIQPRPGEVSPPFDQVQKIAKKKARPSPQEQDDGSGDDMDADGPSGDGGKNAQKKQQGSACQRCKNLKVRCVFDSDPETCKRCQKARMECVIPGKKKRRAPPKREHLLNQIRDQATKIEELMRKLERANRRVAAAASSPTSNKSGEPNFLTTSSRMDGTSSPTSSNSVSSDLESISTGARENEVAPHPDVQAWIDQARNSMRVFTGIIGGGGGAAMYVGEDPEDPASEDSDEIASAYSPVGSDVRVGAEPGNEEVHIGIEGSDGEATTDGLSPRPPASEASTAGRSRSGSPNSGVRKLRTKTSAGKLATAAPSSSSAMGTIKDMSQHLHSRSSSAGAAGTDKLSVLNSNFFKPGTGGEDNPRLTPHTPHILARGLVTPAECEELFKIYFDYMNLSLSLLDPHIYTAQNTCGRSPFLFTVVCAIASRYYTKKTDLYGKLMDYARLAAGTALIGGPKTVDLVHAYILLALYPVPAKRWEDDRSWVYLGLAIRVAMDINIHRPPSVIPKNEHHARELLNRTRAWLNCFNVDRSMGSQYGKAPIISNDDYVAARSATWYSSSPYNLPLFDIHTCAYNAELRVMADFRARTHNDPSHPTGLNRKLDFEKMAMDLDEELLQLENQWRNQLVQSDMADVQNRFRYCLIQLAYGYSRLSALSFGFSHAYGRSGSTQKDQSLLMRCKRAASDVVLVAVDQVGVPNQRIFLRHGPEAQSVFITFASTFLIKLLHPKYAHHLTIDQRVEIRNLVQRVVDLLGSPEVAIDEHHGPKLYSRFLEGLLETPLAQVNPASTLAPPRSQRRRAVAPIEMGPISVPIEQALPTASSVDSFQSMDGAAMAFNADDSVVYNAALAAQQQQYYQQHQDPAETAAALLAEQHHVLGLQPSRYFSPPLPFEPELLMSMQNSAVWSDQMLPGFNWMGELNMQQDMPMQQNMYPMDLNMHPQQVNTMLS